MRAALILVALGGCSLPAATPNARCSTDLDCGSLRCVADLTLGVSYCSNGCITDADCPTHQSCRGGVDQGTSNAAETSVCIDRVRSCEPSETCNGLDDDCDGVIDGPSCTLKARCLDDAPCGAFVCQAPDNQPDTLCAPALLASADDFEACTSNSDCRNGDCATGSCSPFCRADLPGSCPSGFACARSIGRDAAPAHNQCQPRCSLDSDCEADRDCVWRPVYQGADEHVLVCAKPGPNRLPLGAVCPDNTPEGDDACASGLCYERRCTRPCTSVGIDCPDVPGSRCVRRQLYYGPREFEMLVCAES
ncbi:MAG: hypothetical protein HY791_27825 [Deltaproteobacteria bacterium]|nr:hypothetical protein [Deltaproteobacteria bacterium]